MGRLFIMLLLCAVLAHVPCTMDRQMDAQPVFFSMLFPQLIPEEWLDQPDEEGERDHPEAALL